jgi:hypothetical protein
MPRTQLKYLDEFHTYDETEGNYNIKYNVVRKSHKNVIGFEKKTGNENRYSSMQ